MRAKDQQANQDCAAEHDDSDIEPGVKGLVAGGGSQQARSCANRAHPEIKLFRQSASEGKEPKEDGGDYRKDRAENPSAC